MIPTRRNCGLATSSATAWSHVFPASTWRGFRLGGKQGIMVIRVPRSWSAPHQVTFLKDMNFCSRNAAGNNPMSVDELRQSFSSSGNFAERLRDFRAKRFEVILAKDLPFQLRKTRPTHRPSFGGRRPAGPAIQGGHTRHSPTTEKRLAFLAAYTRVT